MQEHIDIIKEKDPIFYAGLEKIIKHFADCYSDKYCSEVKPIEMREFIFNMGDMSKGYNIGNACKYITRVTSEGFEKSDNDIDIVKAAHYLCFEYARRVKNRKVDIAALKDGLKQSENELKDFMSNWKGMLNKVEEDAKNKVVTDVSYFKEFTKNEYIEWCDTEEYMYLQGGIPTRWRPFEVFDPIDKKFADRYKVGFNRSDFPITLERIYEDRT